MLRIITQNNMRPQVDVPRRLVSIAPRRFQTTKPVRRKREYDVEEISFRRTPDHVSHVKLNERPYAVSALGTEIPEDIPQVPLHIEQITDRRLRWFQRTMNEDRLTPEDEDTLKRAMARVSKPDRPVINFDADKSGPSIERMSFFATPGEEAVDDGPVDIGEVTAGLEPGRVVEVRRDNVNHIGMILAPITINLKERLLLLRSTGEIWPVGPNDVQFAMPKSLVPSDLAESAWHPDLLQMWIKGEDIGVSAVDEGSLIGQEKATELMSARRKIASLLRRVLRESERMQGRLLGGSLTSGRGGGMDALWEGLAPSDANVRGHITASKAAEYLLNKANAGEEGEAKHIAVRAGTLPAYAAHMLLMDRPDLFLATDLNMWENATFMVRSRAERERHERIENLVRTQDPEFVAFVDKANTVREAIKNGAEQSALPEWTETERDILYQLTLALLERRGTQTPHSLSLACAIAKWFAADSTEVIDLGVIGPLITELGVLPVFDSTMTSKLVELGIRAGDMGGFTMPASFGETANEPVAADAALDSLRTDLPHRVYVIDDPTALELDDGISLEKAAEDGQYWVHIYVADPTRFIKREGALSRAASFAGTAHYLDEGVVPMLPPSLAGGKLSLGSGGSSGQPVMVFSARLDKSGTVHDWKVGMGFTKNTVVTTYRAVDDALGLDAARVTHPFGKLSEDLISRPPLRHLDSLVPEHTDELKTLLDISLALRAERYKTAGYEWTGPQGLVSVHNASPVPLNMHDRATYPSSPQVWSPRSRDDVQYGYAVTGEAARTNSVSMVTEYMVLANQIAAWFAAERGLGVAFRGSGRALDTSRTPADMTVEKLLAARTPGTGFIEMTRARMASILLPTTQLAVTPLVHWSMGLDAGKGYVWATSPLRRYDDMLAHWQIKGALAAEAGISGGEGVLSHEEVWPLMRRSHFGQQRGRSAQRTAHRFLTAGLLQQRSTGPLPTGYTVEEADKIDLHSPVEAVVVSPPSAAAGMFKVDIVIPSLGLASEMTFPTRNDALRYDVGSNINVVLDKVSLWPLPLNSWKPAA